MKQKLNTFLLALAALAISSLSITAQAQYVNENRWIELTVKSGEYISLDFAGQTNGTGVKVVCGYNSQTFTVGTEYSGEIKEILADNSSTMYIYGNVTKLNCSHNANRVTDIYLRYNSILKDLRATGVGLKTLDTSWQTGLEVLHCALNFIPALDLSKNTSLTDLDCSHGILTELDLRAHDKLKRLNAKSNCLETLIVANGNNANFQGEGTNPAFDASENSNLEYIYVDKGFNPTGLTGNKRWIKDAGASYVDFEYYPLRVANIRVHSANASNITGEGISGKVSYTPSTKTLTLENANILAPSGTYNGIEGSNITINLKGSSNKVTSQGLNGIRLSGTSVINGSGSLIAEVINYGDIAIYLEPNSSLKITGGCTVTASGNYGIGSDLYIHGKPATSTLTVDNATVKAKGSEASIYNFKNLTLAGGCVITSPPGAKFSPSLAGVALNGSIVKGEWVIIEPETDYYLRVGDIKVTSVNASNITGTGITGGKVSYDASSHTLTLNNATITLSGTSSHGISSGSNSKENLTIKLIGTNKINHTGTEVLVRGIYLRKSTCFTGTGTLNVYRQGRGGLFIDSDKTLTFEGGCTVIIETTQSKGIVGFSNCKLVVNNATLKAKSVYSSSLGDGFTSYNFTGVDIISPAGAYFSTSLGGVALNGSLVQGEWVVIEAPTDYHLRVGGIRVTSANAHNITGTAITGGKVSYDAAGHTLTLDDATITLSGNASTKGIESYPESRDNLKINLNGTNRINHTSTNGFGRGIYLRKSTSFTGTGSLNVYCTGSEALLIEANNTLTFEGGCAVSIESTKSVGIKGSSGSKLVVNNATLKAKGPSYSIGKGFTSLSMTGVYISSPEGADFSQTLGGVALNGSLVNQWVVIEPNAPIVSYFIWVAGVEVTSANASNITGPGITGTVSYNHSTETLTLKKATVKITDPQSQRDGIFISQRDLNIKLVGENHFQNYGSGYGIYNDQGNINISGTKSSSLLFDGEQGGYMDGHCIYAPQYMTIDGCHIRAYSNLDAIYVGWSLYLENAAELIAISSGQANGIQYGVNVIDEIEMTGYSTLQAAGDYAVNSYYGIDTYPGAVLFEGSSYNTLKQVSKLSMNGGMTTKPYILIRPNINMERYITLTVKPDVDIKMDFAADADNTGIRIEGGGVGQTFVAGTNWYGEVKFRSQTSTITIYGNIKKFFCFVNYSGLTGLDVSKNTALTELDCSGNNLSTLDVSKNTALTELYCSYNNLSSLDVSKNKALKVLYCDNNKLTYLNVANGNNVNFDSGSSSYHCFDATENPNLKTIYIDKGFTPPTSPINKEWRIEATANYVEYEAYPLWVADTRVTSANASDIKGKGIEWGTVSYDHGTKTLTLNGVFIEIAEVQTQTDGIYVRDQDLQIKLIGYNRIENYGIGDGIRNSNGKLIISGASSSSINIYGDQGGYMDGNCIYTTKDLTIDGVRVYAKSHLDAIKAGPSLYLKNGAQLEAHCSRQASGVHYGVHVNEDIVMTGGSTLKASGDYAVYSNNGIDTYPGAVLFEGSSYNTLKQVSKLSMNGGMTTKPYILIRPTGTDVETLTSQGIQVQGTKSAIRISIDTDEHKYASIYNLTGSLIRVAELEGKETTIGNMQPGIYIVRIGNAAEKVVVK